MKMFFTKMISQFSYEMLGYYLFLFSFLISIANFQKILKKGTCETIEDSMIIFATTENAS